MSEAPARARRIVIVEDDPDLGKFMAVFFKELGYEANVETDGVSAIARVRADNPDAVILDVSLPGKDGFEVCRELRPSYQGVIIMLTGRTDDVNRIVGLELGADDFLAKPVSFRVLESHLKACLRRVEPSKVAAASGSSDELRFGSFRINRATRTVHLAEREVPFQSSEFDLLWLLAQRAGNLLSRDEIMTALRGISHDGIDRSIDMRISRLRKALGDDAGNPRRIKTVRGKGYIFSTMDWD